MNLSCTLAGLTLEHPLMNAAGTVKNLDDVRKMAETAVSAIVLGSITYDARPGNAGNTFVSMPDGAFAVNSIGLTNDGLIATVARMPDMLAIAHDKNKPLIVSVAGFSPSEYGILADTVNDHGADIIELNLGCPNVWGPDGKQKRLASVDPDLIRRIVEDVEERITENARLIVKLSPLEPSLLATVGRVLSEKPIVKAVVCSNTFPNALVLHPNGRPVIDSPQVPKGLGGLSGPALKPIALGQVQQMKELLQGRDIQVVGVGGISTGQDMKDYLSVGATAVQVATAFLSPRGGQVFTDILTQYVELG